MKLYSTKNKTHLSNLKDAVLLGQAPDGGLYMPEEVPFVEYQDFPKLSFNDIAFQVAKVFFKDELSTKDLQDIINQAYDFDAPLISLNENLHILELFHGHTLAFKDFGARFMARLMSYYIQNENKNLTVLVATSGDTGSAVASAFHKVENINVIILYPSGKVSPLQELQLTTWGDNIRALEVEGTFDDCQKLVKTAFQDQTFKEELNLTSANSINIARLIPQSFYYFYSYSRLNKANAIFCTPSGNFGNLTAGLIAKKMGLPVKRFIAATNLNHVVPDYLQSGVFTPKPSVQTLSNAMDVGNPSNLIRLQELYQHNLDEIRQDLQAFYFNDQETLEAIQECQQQYDYLLCPHTAVAYLAAKKYQKNISKDPVIVLATAHHAKFLEVVKKATNTQILLPEPLKKIVEKQKIAELVPADYDKIKATIRGNLL